MEIKPIISAIKTLIRRNPEIKSLVCASEDSLKSVADTKPLFCHQIWGKMYESGQLNPITYRTCVSNHGILNSFNYMLINGATTEKLSQVLPFYHNRCVKDIIKSTDIEFRRLKPIPEKITVYRCVGEKPDFFSEYKLYKKRFNIKKGDVINMQEYAYSASDTNYAKVYIPNEKGIMYEISVPKGARVSLTGEIKDGFMPAGNECVFPRNSKFKCLSRSVDEKGLAHVKLEYILPDEPWRVAK